GGAPNLSSQKPAEAGVLRPEQCLEGNRITLRDPLRYTFGRRGHHQRFGRHQSLVSGFTGYSNVFATEGQKKRGRPSSAPFYRAVRPVAPVQPRNRFAITSSAVARSARQSSCAPGAGGSSPCPGSHP